MQAVRNRWKLFETLQIIPINDELYIFNFIVRDEMQQVLDSQPWSLYGQLLLIHPFIPGTPPQEVVFQDYSMWFSFKQLPYTY